MHSCLVISNMSRNLAHQISRNLHSDCFAMVLTASFYCDSRAHNVRKVQVVKYIVVYGQIFQKRTVFLFTKSWSCDQLMQNASFGDFGRYIKWNKHHGFVQPEYWGPALKVVHFDWSGHIHFGRSDRNVPFHLKNYCPYHCFFVSCLQEE